MAFCSKCGAQVADVAKYCPVCGNDLSAGPVAAPAQVSPQYQPVQPYQPAPQQYPGYDDLIRRHYGPGSFAELLHGVGGSALFLVAAILFSAGAVSSLAGLVTNPFSIFSLALSALPIIAVWLVYAGSKSPGLPEKTRPALSLAKIYVIITFVAECIAVFVLVIAALVIFGGSRYVSGYTYGYAGIAGSGAVLGAILLLFAAGFLTFCIFYFVATLDVINGLNLNLLYNSFNPLKRIKAFSVLTYILVGLSVFGSMIAAFSLTAMNTVLSSLPDVADSLFAGVFHAAPFVVLFGLAQSAGIVLLVICLNQLNAKLLLHNQAQ